jgi:hypothetical protein
MEVQVEGRTVIVIAEDGTEVSRFTCRTPALAEAAATAIRLQATDERELTLLEFDEERYWPYHVQLRCSERSQAAYAAQLQVLHRDLGDVPPSAIDPDAYYAERIARGDIANLFNEMARLLAILRIAHRWTYRDEVPPSMLQLLMGGFTPPELLPA